MCPDPGMVKGIAAIMVYFVRIEARGLVKIGTSGEFVARLQSLRSRLGPVTVLGVLPGGRDVERRLHAAFGPLRVEGEMFRPAAELMDYVSAEARPWGGEREVVGVAASYPAAGLLRAIRRAETSVERIVIVREYLGLSRHDLAERLGVTCQRIANVESGRRAVALEWVYRVAVAMGCRPRIFDSRLTLDRP